MRLFARVVLFLCVLTMAVPLAAAGGFEPDADGPWINVDIVDLVDAGDATYLEYLGKGYIALLDALKTEETILDYGVMMKTTGSASEGDVVIWWSIASLADYEKALERMGELSAEMWTGDEMAEFWSKLEKVRRMKSSNLYRAVLWKSIEE